MRGCLHLNTIGQKQSWPGLAAAPSSTAASSFRPWRRGYVPGNRLPVALPTRASTAVAGDTDRRAKASTEDVGSWNRAASTKRLAHLEEQARSAMKAAVENFEHPAFPCALIMGDVVILELLHREGLLQSGRVPVVFVDTFHLFPETHTLLHRLEEKYGFKAHVYQAKGFASKQDYQKVHGSDLYITDTEKYDQICKVEPFSRALAEQHVDVMINGRRRDHGFDRAHLQVFEDGTPVTCNPLAYWEFRDCFDFVESNGLEAHPLHAQGFPSIGDVHSTVPVPKEKWFEYGGERSGRFQGFTNADGSLKTECGIHVAR